jgi:hypothetical protein
MILKTVNSKNIYSVVNNGKDNRGAPIHNEISIGAMRNMFTSAGQENVLGL